MWTCKVEGNVRAVGARSEPAQDHFHQVLLEHSCFKWPHFYWNIDKRVSIINFKPTFDKTNLASPRIWTMKEVDMTLNCLFVEWGVSWSGSDWLSGQCTAKMLFTQYTYCPKSSMSRPSQAVPYTGVPVCRCGGGGVAFSVKYGSLTTKAS